MLTATAAEAPPEHGLSGQAQTMPTASLSVVPLTAHRAFALPSTGSVLPPLTLVGRVCSMSHLSRVSA